MSIKGELFRGSETEFCNQRKKYIVDENGIANCVEIMTLSRPIFNPHGLEIVNNNMHNSDISDKLANEKEAILKAEVENMTSALGDRIEDEKRNVFMASQRRAKRQLRDYIMADFDLVWFVTITLNGEHFERNDIETACKKLNKYCANRVQRNGLKYVIVPELHKDGKSIHFHGFFNDALKFIPSGTYIAPGYKKPVRESTIKKRGISFDDCTEVFNIPDWKHGFTTAIKIYGDRAKAGSYIAKYISKEIDENSIKKICGRFYYSSNNLRKPVYEYGNADYEEIDGFQIETGYIGIKIQQP